MYFHPKSEETVQEFDNAWKEFIQAATENCGTKNDYPVAKQIKARIRYVSYRA